MIISLTTGVVGGKWTRTLADADKEKIGIAGIKGYIGAGEKYFVSRPIDYRTYPSWNSRDFKMLRNARPDFMTTRGGPHPCHFCHNTEEQTGEKIKRDHRGLIISGFGLIRPLRRV
jgi:hypothetical protein